MGLVKVTPKQEAIYAIEFTGKNKEDVRKAVSDFATVREEENDAIAITRKGIDIGKIMYPNQVLVITGATTQVYSKARFEAEFDVEVKPKAPKKPVAEKLKPQVPVVNPPQEPAVPEVDVSAEGVNVESGLESQDAPSLDVGYTNAE